MTVTEHTDTAAEIAPARLCATPPVPRSVKIELCGRCNYACHFCALRTRAKQPTEDMDFALFRRITREMREAGAVEIGLFYLGESFINPQLLVAACQHVKKELRFPYVFLTSNASLATPTVVERLMQLGLDSLTWSINAADAAQFTALMGVKPSLFRDALANIRLAHEGRRHGGYRTGLYASSIRYDGEQRHRMEALLAEHVRPYVDEHYWLPLYSMAMRCNDPKTGLPTRSPLPCWSVFTEGHVRVDGHMSACCFGSDARFDVGDLTRESFIDAWQSDAMRALRAAQIRTQDEGPAALKGTICDGCVAYSD